MEAIKKPELLNFHQACKYMGIGSQRMYELLDAGIVRRINYSSNRKPFLQSDLDRAMERLKVDESKRNTYTKAYVSRRGRDGFI